IPSLFFLSPPPPSKCTSPLSLPPSLCVFEGRHFSLGETWMDNACMQCTLHKPPVVHRPVDFPAWCEVRVEPVSCKVSLVQTADRRLPCSPGEDLKDPKPTVVPGLKLKEAA
uniref:Microseminoprotein, prostate associated n=1 Tax=Echeneis naucrates TaxID=173247 RepID=A0A665USR9_ECHNA